MWDCPVPRGGDSIWEFVLLGERKSGRVGPRGGHDTGGDADSSRRADTIRTSLRGGQHNLRDWAPVR